MCELVVDHVRAILDRIFRHLAMVKLTTGFLVLLVSYDKI